MRHPRTLIALTLLTVGLSACASGPEERQSASDYMHDTGITTRVKTALIKDPDVHAMEIHVETMGGKVRLYGRAASQKEIDRAAEIAAAVEGVDSVRNDIELSEKEIASESPKP